MNVRHKKKLLKKLKAEVKEIELRNPGLTSCITQLIQIYDRVEVGICNRCGEDRDLDEYNLCIVCNSVMYADEEEVDEILAESIVARKKSGKK